MKLGLLGARLIFAAMVGAAALYVHWSWLEFKHGQELAEAKENLRKLASLTAHRFPERDLGDAKAFWKSIGRDEPMKDPWGQEFQLVVEAQEKEKLAWWQSSGPDRAWSTQDDLKQLVPFPKGMPPEAEAPGQNVESAPAR